MWGHLDCSEAQGCVKGCSKSSSEARQALCLFTFTHSMTEGSMPSVFEMAQYRPRTGECLNAAQAV
jgi:hypothetical protein